MDINELLKKDIVEFLNTHYDTSYVKRLQSIAEVNQVVNTPYYEECLQGFQAIDPYNTIHSNLDLYETYANQLLQLHTMIETEKIELVRFLRNIICSDDIVSQVRERIEQFHHKKDKLCEIILHQLEYILEYQVVTRLKLKCNPT
jgi:hypothetical protein